MTQANPAGTAPKVIVLTAPSGAGKSTIAKHLIDAIPSLRFSVSATTRPPRAYEKDGVHYHFLSEEQFRQRIADGALLEYEEVYPGRFYGTLKSEVLNSSSERPVLLDIEVKGASNIKKLLGDDALTLFIRPPSLEMLAKRLRKRNTETEDMLRERLGRARLEMTYADRCDAVIVNDDLDEAVAEALKHVRCFLAD